MAGDREHEAKVLELRDGVDAWLDQARWLYEQENARLDGVRTRATTLLGFCGGILAILAGRLSAVTHTASSRVSALFAIAGTVGFAVCALLLGYVLWNVLVTRPSHEALLGAWDEWRTLAALPDEAPKRKVFVNRDFVNLLLHPASGDADSPVVTAGAAATARANALNLASGVFAVALLSVAVSIVAQLVGDVT